ncbi:MAG: ATP-dependent helicase [Opitutales bacterium]
MAFTEEGGASLAPIDFRADLNDEQYAAVVAEPGPSLVLAGAGSGKTRTLTYRVAWLLTEQGLRPWEILLLTFTNKAAREMLERVEDLTGERRERFWGGTFHSIGQRILRRHGATLGLESGFTILDDGESQSLLGDAIRIVDSDFLKNKENPKARVVSDIISYARNTRQSVKAVVEGRYPWFNDLADKLTQFHKAYQERKLAQQVTDYDDLLEYWLRLLEEAPEVRAEFQARFRHILVDEYQDTNRLQASILNLLAAEHQNITIVGDNWQCIYTWRGAEFANMADFAEVFPERGIYKIETNYRSSPEILDFANELMSVHPPIDGYPLLLRPDKPSNQKPYFIPTMDTRQQAALVCKRIEGLLNEGYSLADMAVLYRAHFHAMDLQMELSRQGVPYTITSGVRFFEQAHVRDLVAMLRFAHNPRDAIAFQRFTGLLPKVGPRTSERLLKLAGKVASKRGLSLIQALARDEVAEKAPEPAREDFKAMAASLVQLEAGLRVPEAEGVRRTPAERQGEGGSELFDGARAADAPAKDTAAFEPLMPEEIVELAVEGWYGDYLKSAYANWTTRRDDLESLAGFAARYEDFGELLAQLVLLNSETSDRAAEPNEETIRLTTIHQAKGLEFPVVFIIGLADGLFPLKRAIEEGDIEEERRLFYVAVTRAKDELYMLYPRVSLQGGPPQMLQPSRFFQAVDEARFEILRTQAGAY